MSPISTDVPEFTRTCINLASAGLGARGVFATDEFFAPLERLLNDETAVFVPDKYDDHGKWMDGWESRRRRDGKHDHAIIALAAIGRIEGFDIDTSHFTGNYPPAARIEACLSDGDPDDATVWTEILPVKPLGPNAHHYFPCARGEVWSHLRLHILPDGGVARLRVYGRPRLNLATQGENAEIDLASSLNGGRVVAFSDAHYGAYQRLLAPGRGQNMGDGWETRRLRQPGNDWIIIELGARGTIASTVVDTAFFKGNFPDRCSIQGADVTGFGARTEPVAHHRSRCSGRNCCQRTKAAPRTHIHDLGEYRACHAIWVRSRTSGSTYFPMAASVGSGCLGRLHE